MHNVHKIGIIGAGNMAQAIVGGILRGGLLEASDIIISDVSSDRLALFAEMGVATTSDNALLSSQCQYLLFAVKPQSAPAIFEEIRHTVKAERIMSIMAGISLDTLQNAFGSRKYARIMPNTPALVGEGMACIAFSDKTVDSFIIEIFKSVGKVAIVDESLFDAVTSLSGSGPAYVYAFIKALIDGGMDGGLDFETSKALALQTVTGAVKMIENSDKPISELIDAVCSKGGTTIEAINSFKQDKLEDIVISGMRKCRRRSEELSGKHKRD